MTIREIIDSHNILICVCIAIVLFSGCLGDGSTPTSQTIESPSSTPTRSTDTPSTPEPTTPIEYGIDVPNCPERPQTFTDESVEQFAMQFEQAYVSRTLLRDTSANITSIRVSTDDPNSTDVGSGWIVHFSALGPATTSNPPDSTETEHSDPPVYTANYFVSETRIIRLQAVSAVDPREDGERVFCPPRS